MQAKAGQSGRDNRISYEITVVDGTSSYKVKTNDVIANEISIFNRIDGSIDVTNSTVVYGSTFAISNWDAIATFNESDLTWNITNFGNLTNRAMPAGVHSGFTLIVSATQKYNGHDISWSKSVGFNMIYYADGSGERIYKKQGASYTLRGAYATDTNRCHSGWSTSVGGGKAYSLNQNYSASGDLTLHPYWTDTYSSRSLGSDIDKAFGAGKVLSEWETIDNLPTLNYGELRSVGRSQVTASFYGNILIWGRTYVKFRLYNVSTGVVLGSTGETELVDNPPTSATRYYSGSFTFSSVGVEQKHPLVVQIQYRRNGWASISEFTVLAGFGYSNRV